MTTRRLLPVALAALALVAACGGDDGGDAATTTTERPTTTTAPPPPAPLTGEPVDDEAVLERPALVVKIDNAGKARARQDGLHRADLVYVEKVEGGATRLAAVFHSTQAESVGPVRSARTSDVDIVANLNRPLFAFSGANTGVMRIVRAANLVDVGYDAATSAYEEHGTGVLRLFVSTKTMFGLAPDGAGPPPALFQYRVKGEPVANAGAEDVDGVRIAYGGQVNANATYEVSDAGWRRFQDGTPHEVGGSVLEPENVVVQFTEYRNSGFRDVSGAFSPEAVTVGEGEAWVLTDGRLVRGRWSRPDPGAPAAYTDAAGQPILLTPGRTWVELAPAGSATVLTPPPPTTEG